MNAVAKAETATEHKRTKQMAWRLYHMDGPQRWITFKNFDIMHSSLLLSYPDHDIRFDGPATSNATKFVYVGGELMYAAQAHEWPIVDVPTRIADIY